MEQFEKSGLNKIVRGAKRATYSRNEIYEVVDNHFLCHLAYVYEGTPIVIPTAYGRKNDTFYIHGSTKNRMMNALLESEIVSATITHTDGIVLARSVFHHSFNYRSAVIFGKPRLVEEESERMEALKIITENIIPGRWKEARLPNDKEMKATAIVAIEITDASAKIRAGGPVDEPEDYDLEVWAGVLPIKTSVGSPIVDSEGNQELPISSSVMNYNL